MCRLAFLNLIQNKTRLLLSVGGLTLALTLVLFFDAVFKGAEERLTVYIDEAGADIWVSQQGVRTMHMSASSLPASVIEEVSAVSGVQRAQPILYATDMIRMRDREYISYVFGLPVDATLGTPTRYGDATMPGPGEVVVDRAIAGQAGVGVGDEAVVLGRPMRIVGQISGTSTIANSVAFITMEDFGQARGQEEVISFVLVTVDPDESAAAVAERIAMEISGVTVQTSERFASEERKLARDMMADMLSMMNTAGLLTGLAVLALTVYVGTIARRKEYGVLKAMGVQNRRLYQVVTLQALISVGLGLLAAVGVTLLLSLLIPRLNELLILTLSVQTVAQVGLIAIVLAAMAAILPARQIASIEPIAIIRKG